MAQDEQLGTGLTNGITPADWMALLNRPPEGATWPGQPSDPFERAAQRQRTAVQPPGGRKEGWLTENPDFGMVVPRSPTEAAMMFAGGPIGGKAAKIGALLGSLALDPTEAEAAPLRMLKQTPKAIAAFTEALARYGKEGKQVEGPVNRAFQTVANPYRMAFPGIYRNPAEIAAMAAENANLPENPLMKQLWGVTRGDLNEMAQGRVGNQPPAGVIPSKNPRGSVSAENIQTPQNTQRLIDILGEAGKYPNLAHADAWYIMDPVYQRIKQMGFNDPVGTYQHFNTMTGMASPGSDVLTEIQRGTLAHALEKQGRFADFQRYGGLAEEKRGTSYPADMAYVMGHPYHGTSQAGPMAQYIERGGLQSESPKVPLYVHASGVPETGFQTSAPVGDAHFSRAVGLADTRKGPTDIAASFSRPEYETLTPWWRDKVAAGVGLESVPAQARLWTVMGPQTGVDSPLGQGKLELLSQQIGVAAKRLGVSPETARDMILRGRAGAGAVVGGMPLVYGAARQWPALTDHLEQ